ncbi:hypothetical protein JS520_00785 [Candidatus Vidania fulgoroideae]|nr:hypothetical protein JS520_00785 [Candidatus Vidania fulgoroideae]
MRHKKHKKYSQQILNNIQRQIKELLLRKKLTTTHKYGKILIKKIHITKTIIPINKITINTLKYRQKDNCKLVILRIS